MNASGCGTPRLLRISNEVDLGGECQRKSPVHSYLITRYTLPNALHAILKIEVHRGPSLSREQFIHMRSLLHMFILQQYSEDLDRGVQLQHVCTSPALESGDADAWL